MSYSEILQLYFDAIRHDGDYLNDWLTHLPDWLAQIALTWGIYLAEYLGFSQGMLATHLGF